MLKAIAFDLWETLITDTPELSRQQERLRLTRMESILTARGHAPEAEQIERAYRTVWRRCHELYWSRDVDIACRRQIEVFLEELGVGIGTGDRVTRLVEYLDHGVVRQREVPQAGARDHGAEHRIALDARLGGEGPSRTVKVVPEVASDPLADDIAEDEREADQDHQREDREQ